jgi:predicted AAA+ superfamily ATPase
MNRYLFRYILDDLKEKMVWLGGARQVGKTTLSKQLATQQYRQFEYLNWDSDRDRQAILKEHWQSSSELIIFDELHKYPHWKQWIKGLYDTKLESQQFFLTDSVRMDVHKKGGDSLVGRYHYWRLHPLTLDELPSDIEKNDVVDRLLELGGFPEPFIHGDIRKAKRWRKERFQRVLLEDIRELESIRELPLLDLLISALRERVGSMLVISNLAQDLKVTHKTCTRWLTILESMYLVFPVYPLTKNIPRAIQKPAKVYFYDNGDVVNSNGARFENLVATHLLKRLQFREDYEGSLTSLHYIRDRDGREVDFVTIVDGEVYELIEVKLSEDKISSALRYYKEKLNPKYTVQIVKSLKKIYDHDGIRVTTPEDYFSEPIW